MEKDIPCTCANQKKAGVAILISDKLDIRAKENYKRQKEHHIMWFRGSVHPEDRTILNVYAPKQQNFKYMKQNSQITEKY